MMKGESVMIIVHRHLRLSLAMTLILFVGLFGCIAEQTKSDSAGEGISPVVQAEKGTDQAPSGEIQERGISRMLPSLTKPQAGGTLQFMPGTVPNPPAFGTLPGDFTIRTYLKNTPWSARDGGHHSINAVITVPSVIGPYQRFKLASVQPDFTTIQTAGGYYVSAAGGLGGLPNTTQPVQTELQTPQNDLALFRIEGPSAQGLFSIKTFGGYFLTALGGGGKSTDAFHSDATRANTWEYFWVLKCGDLGSGYTYAIRPAGTGSAGTVVNFLTANGGGGRTSQAMTAFSGLFDGSKFKLIRQLDGSYALQTSNRVNYVTAVGGGGLASGENLQTNRTQVQAWEQFKIVEHPPNCGYTIQTVSGFYLAVGGGGTKISTRISDPKAAPSIGYNAIFELIMIGL